MRNQNCIYNQIEDVNVNISTDICVFEMPKFEISGATKLLTGITETDQSVYFIENKDFNLNLIFDFNVDMSSISDSDKFSFQLNKFDDNNLSFNFPNFYESEKFVYQDFKIDNILNVSTSHNVTEDSEFIIKSTWEIPNCTNILNKLGLINKITSFSNNSKFYLYNDSYDYYFIVLYKAATPIFNLTPDSQRPVGSLNSFSLIANNETTFSLPNGINGVPIITLNGSALKIDDDFTLDTSSITLLFETKESDIITFFYVGKGGKNGLIIDSFSINKPILSGSINNQGNEKFYLNNSTGKFELFIDSLPIEKNDILLSINGVVLANGLDYHLSTSNKKRIILEGTLLPNDVINIVYNAYPTFVGNINKKEMMVYWTINKPPNKNNGYFTLELSTYKNFDVIAVSKNVNYVIGKSVYSEILEIDGVFGDKFYYRVVNNKIYQTIIGDEIISSSTSEVIPIIVNSNFNNNY